MVAFDPHNGEVLVSDLGLDSVMVYALTGSGALVERPERRIEMTPGAGPRHLAFHPDGHRLFVANELDNTLVALRRDGERFVPTATASTLPDEFESHSQAAAVRVSPSGVACSSPTAVSIATRSRCSGSGAGTAGSS